MLRINKEWKLKEAYILGAGTLGNVIKSILVKNGINFLGFIDNNKTECLSLSDITDKSANIIVASINYMYEMTEQLKGVGFCNYFVFTDMIDKFPELSGFNSAFVNLFDDYFSNKEEYDFLRTLFQDEESLSTLEHIIEYRKTKDYTLFSKTLSPSRPYFNSLIPKDDNMIFVDGGAFDGDTVNEFTSFSAYKKIYVFEPDIISFEKAKKNLIKFENIVYFNKGISNESKIIGFNLSGTLGASFDEGSDSKIECVKLDDVVEEDKVFIKLDIEGAEIEALQGAERLIKNGSILAVCVYHKPEHIYQVPRLILSINKDYNLYLRHHSTSIFETVLYAIPKV